MHDDRPTCTRHDRDLWQRLEAFRVGRGDEALTFERRLARENGWTLAKAERVFAEYRRFVYLAMTAGHPVTPSEDVDQAWHLHLTYTRSYWHDLCRDTLGRDLHHGPTEGGRAEGAKFFDWYGRTLESYRRLFGEEPDPAVWPAPVARFTHAGDGLWVRRSETITIPRRRAWWGAAATALVALAGYWSWPHAEADTIRTADGTGILVLFGVVFVFAIVAAISKANSQGRRRRDTDTTSDAGTAATGWWFFGGGGCGTDSSDSGGGDAGCGGGGCGGGGCGGCGG